MNRIVVGVVLVSLGLLGGACTASAGTGGQLEGVIWSLKSFGEDSTSTPGGAAIDARFDMGTVKGVAGCNNYSATYTATGSSLKIGPTATTQMACPEPIMAVEQLYLAALGKATTYTATKDALTIYDSVGKQLLDYVPGPSSPEGAWTVLSYNNVKEAVVSVAAGSTLTAAFGNDGTLSGSGGCNSFNGSYKVAGEQIKIGPLASTRMACDQAAMDQESAYLTALQNAATWAIQGNGLELRATDGALQVTFQAQ